MITDTKGTSHAKMGMKGQEDKVDKILSKKDKNGMDLTEAEDFKKRWEGYTEELYKKKKTKP